MIGLGVPKIELFLIAFWAAGTKYQMYMCFFQPRF